VDNNTKLIRRVTLDLRKSVEKRGAPDIKAADFTVDYTSTTPNGSPQGRPVRLGAARRRA
jgi:hypothetical protein